MHPSIHPHRDSYNLRDSDILLFSRVASMLLTTHSSIHPPSSLSPYSIPCLIVNSYPLSIHISIYPYTEMVIGVQALAQSEIRLAHHTSCHPSIYLSTYPYTEMVIGVQALAQNEIRVCSSLLILPIYPSIHPSIYRNGNRSTSVST